MRGCFGSKLNIKSLWAAMTTLHWALMKGSKHRVSSLPTGAVIVIGLQGRFKGSGYALYSTCSTQDKLADDKRLVESDTHGPPWICALFCVPVCRGEHLGCSSGSVSSNFCLLETHAHIDDLAHMPIRLRGVGYHTMYGRATRDGTNNNRELT